VDDWLSITFYGIINSCYINYEFKIHKFDVFISHYSLQPSFIFVLFQISWNCNSQHNTHNTANLFLIFDYVIVYFIFCIGSWLKLIHFLSVSTCSFNDYCLMSVWFCFVDAYKWVCPVRSTSGAIWTVREVLLVTWPTTFESHVHARIQKMEFKK
jgi:hypothetical protein